MAFIFITILLRSILMVDGATFVADSSTKPMIRRDTGALPAQSLLEPVQEAGGEDTRNIDACEYVFPDGTADTDDCGLWSRCDDVECEAAAQQTKVARGNHFFTVGEHWQLLRPEGCFRGACTTNAEGHAVASGQCMFYNERMHGDGYIGASWCSSGITSLVGTTEVCCEPGCGECGGSELGDNACSSRPGGAAGCCPATIMATGRACTHPDDIKCLVTNATLKALYHMGDAGSPAVCPAGWAPITELTMCQRATSVVGKTFGASGSSNDDRLPHCYVGSTGDVNFNPAGDEGPTGNSSANKVLCRASTGYSTAAVGPLVGTPVCKKPRFIAGNLTAATSGSGWNAHCPTGYEHLPNEANCSVIGNCDRYCNGAAFNVNYTYADARDRYPHGCFIHTPLEGGETENPCIYWNPPPADSATVPAAGVTQADGTVLPPRGTPLCRATEAALDMR